MSRATLGPLTVSRVGGEPQIVRRSAEPVSRLKLGLLLHGTAVVSQSGRQVLLEPEQMALYDPTLPYEIRLEQRWSFLVLTFPRNGLSLPTNIVRLAMRQAHPFRQGPGAVLAGFAAAALRQCGLDGACATRLGEAGLHLIAGALATTKPGDGTATADSQRQQVLEYARKHLSEGGSDPRPCGGRVPDGPTHPAPALRARAAHSDRVHPAATAGGGPPRSG
ncbi:hypothetical protein [Paractinoplanes brasiliensis]|uniref:AraC-like ligand-binding domain-containing protein n=1 Tax=Paractinoplanes brasiliensis TaxID=52695 RepID=UPI00105FF7B5|nr:hypothetical protein [Actinoplanes brasiliensis]